MDNDLELDSFFDESSQSDCDEEILSQELSQVSLEDLNEFLVSPVYKKIKLETKKIIKAEVLINSKSCQFCGVNISSKKSNMERHILKKLSICPRIMSN